MKAARKASGLIAVDDKVSRDGGRRDGPPVLPCVRLAAARASVRPRALRASASQTPPLARSSRMAKKHDCRTFQDRAPTCSALRLRNPGTAARRCRRFVLSISAAFTFQCVSSLLLESKKRETQQSLERHHARPTRSRGPDRVCVRVGFPSL